MAVAEIHQTVKMKFDTILGMTDEPSEDVTPPPPDVFRAGLVVRDI